MRMLVLLSFGVAIFVIYILTELSSLNKNIESFKGDLIKLKEKVEIYKNIENLKIRITELEKKKR
ncbi:MAG: hypothetical protein ISS82_00570 [Nanoarchaeota archaeon]|nr:hypothetical protein [Nanoarchaeota archaeon]